jgi:hypothetical protein
VLWLTTMPRKLPPNPDEKPQLQRFLDAVERSEADKTDAALKATVRKIAKPLPTSPTSKRSGGSRA